MVALFVCSNETYTTTRFKDNFPARVTWAEVAGSTSEIHVRQTILRNKPTRRSMPVQPNVT